VSLSLGKNTITVTDTNKYNVTGSDTVEIIYDPKAPTIIIEYPEDGIYIGKSDITITGTISDISITEARLIINDLDIMPVFASNGEFSVTTSFEEGWNTIEIKATNGSGNTGSSGKVSFYVVVSLITVVDSAGDVGKYSSIAIDNDNCPHISYYDTTNDDLKYAKRTVGIWEIETVDSTGDVGYYNSIAIDKNGYPNISYYDGTNKELKHAVWSENGWYIETVDSKGDAGYYSSIDVDEYGYPHISYYDWTDNDLKYAVWNGIKWSIEVVDNSDGIYISIELDDNR